MENEKTCGFVTCKTLRDDVNALGTFLIYNGFKGKNIAIMGGSAYEWAVSYLAVACGTGVAVPLDEEWDIHELKRYINATDCACIIFSKTYENIVWDVYNDGVTFLQTCIYMGSKESESPFISMEEAIDGGRDCIAFGNRDFLDAQIARDDFAAIQSIPDTDIPKPALLTHGNIEALLLSFSKIVRADEKEIFFSPLPISRSLENICGLWSSLHKGSPIFFDSIRDQIIALNPSGGNVNAAVGRALPGVEAKIAGVSEGTGVGEICFRGFAVAIGYYNKPDYDTPIYPSVIKDGWYCTGHRGRMDGNDYIHILE
jgi:long-chain acyl-CoA synthetase